jgi:bacillithiol synthase
VIPDCISFNAIPHTTRIFSDFLSYSPEIRKFYPTQPDAVHIAAFAKSVPRDRARQAQVADALEKQNRAWGASEATLRNIQRLRDGAFAVVTGQQVGLFGGALLSLLKSASVLALAKQVEELGVECVPIFWLATEDHDLASLDLRSLPSDSPKARTIRSHRPLSCWASLWLPITCARATSKARHFLTPTPSFTPVSLVGLITA